ncbi:hypothetical protein M9H77_12923 [Catharanthus roseus]|uniref:Uncharacterized protein n=1 Tax=Catharanthus roseus TaxID=4058 RepID=A0ACC0BIP4_CATRO|nr:hypothetical protein M9H77_12923 [Catharanthus roseus]
MPRLPSKAHLFLRHNPINKFNYAILQKMAAPKLNLSGLELKFANQGSNFELLMLGQDYCEQFGTHRRELMPQYQPRGKGREPIHNKGSKDTNVSIPENLNINREVSKRFATIQESQKVLVRRIEVLLLADIEKLKEDVACLTKHNVDLKHDFVEIKVKRYYDEEVQLPEFPWDCCARLGIQDIKIVLLFLKYLTISYNSSKTLKYTLVLVLRMCCPSLIHDGVQKRIIEEFSMWFRKEMHHPLNASSS